MSRKITFVFDGLQFGGIERVGVEYIKLLKERGYDIGVINLKPRLVEMEKELPCGVPVTHINYPRWITPQKYSKFKRKLGAPGRFVFALFFLFFSLFDNMYSIFYRKKLKPTDIAISFSGHYNDLTFVTKSFGSNVKKIAWLHSDQYSYDEMSSGFFDLYKKIKNLVCVSNWNDDKVIAFNKANSINKIKLYNPVNLDDRQIDSNKVAALKEKYGDFIIMVGRLAKDKDQATLIKALGVLRLEYNLDKYLLLVGDGTERERLERLASSLNLSDRVIFTGSVYDVQNYYLSSFLYAHSSPAEGFGLVFVEAMFYGVPVVSTDCIPGSREILGDDEYGLISKVGDERELAENIWRIYSNSSLRTEFVTKGRERIKEFLPSTIITRLEGYMESLK